MFLKLLVSAIESTLFQGGEGVYTLSGVTEKWQESEINTIVWVFQLLLAGIVDNITSKDTLKHNNKEVTCSIYTVNITRKIFTRQIFV